MGPLNGVGVKARAATAKRLGLDAHGMTPASVSGGRGALPLPPELSAARVGSPEGQSPCGQGPKARCKQKKPLPSGQAFSRPQAVLFRGKASLRAEPY
jgi:hypothetical protein